MKKILICEKRSAVSELLESNYFGKPASFKSHNGYIENDKFIIIWCAGHLYRLADPNEINPDYALKFSVQDNFDYHIPELKNEVFGKAYTKPRTQTDTFYKEVIKRLDAIIHALSRKDYDEIIFCADPDDEGEKIHSDPVKYNKKIVNKNIKFTRFWNVGSYKSSVAVQKAFENRESISEDKYKNRLHAANARSLSDYLIGMIITKLLSDYTGVFFRCGRVNSNIVGIIGNREKQILNFKPQTYWHVKGTLNKDNQDLKFNHYYDSVDLDENGDEIKSNETRYFIEEEMQEVLKKTKEVQYKGKVVQNTKRETSSRKPKLYSTDEFNAEFMSQYNVSLEYSNAHLEWLKDNGYTSYPRTNGNYFMTDNLEIVQKTIDIATQYFAQEIKKIQSQDKKFTIQKLDEKNAVFDNKKAANQNHTPLHLEGVVSQKDLQLFASNPKHKERNIELKHLKEAYEMIATRCLVQVMPDDIIQKENLTIEINGYLFETNAEKVIYSGWKQFDKYASSNKNTVLGVDYKKGDDIQLDDVFSVENQTKVPPHYTQKTLLTTLMLINDALNDEYNSIDDPAIKKQKMADYKTIKKQLKTVNGLGTQATRETIYQNIEKDKVFQINKKKEIILTDHGWFIYNNLPEQLKSLSTTALWEQKLSDIRTGAYTYDLFIAMVTESINQMVDEVIEKKKNGLLGQGKIQSKNKPSEKQIEFVKRIAQKLNIKVTKDNISSFDAANDFINQYKEQAFPQDKRILSENQIKFLKNPEVQTPQNFLDLIESDNAVSLEDYEAIRNFISEKIEFFKNNPTPKQKDFYTFSDKQLKVLKDPRNKEKLSAMTVELLSKENKYTPNEYQCIKKDLDEIFKSFK